MGTYATAADVRAEPDVDDAATDAELNKAIDAAEDQIDDWLGAWPVDTTTGRKIVEADVDAWRFAKLTRAVVRLAAHLFNDPTILAGEQWGTVKGPDFEKSNAAPALRKISDVAAPLNASGLRVLGARASA